MAPPAASIVGVTVIDQKRLPPQLAPGAPTSDKPTASAPSTSLTRPMSPPPAEEPEPALSSDERPRSSSILPKLGAAIGAVVVGGLVLAIVAVVAIVVITRSRGPAQSVAPPVSVSSAGATSGVLSWVDVQGEQFEAGYSGECPSSAICLAGTGLEGSPAVERLHGHPVGNAGARRLDTYVRCAAFLQQAGANLAPWGPANADARPSECLRLFPGDRAWTVGLSGEPVPLDLDDWSRGSTAPYRMSSFARDLVRGVSDGSRAWTLLLEKIDPTAPDPSADLYRLRLGAGIELGLISGSLGDMDGLPRALDAAIAHSGSLVVRLPSDPLVAFDGHGPFTMGSGFRRELDALSDLAERRQGIDFELCVVDLQEPTKAHPDPAAWDGARLDYLDQATAESSGRIGVCHGALQVADSQPQGDDSPCDPYRESLFSQTLLVISATP